MRGATFRILLLALALSCPPLLLAATATQEQPAATPSKPQPGAPADNANRKPGADDKTPEHPDEDTGDSADGSTEDNADDNDTDVDDGDDDSEENDSAVDPSSPCPHKTRTCWPEAVEREQQRLDRLPAPDGSALADQLGDSVHQAPEFGGMEQEAGWSWQWRFQPSAKENNAKDSSWLDALRALVAALSHGFGTLGHVALWLLLLFLLVLLWRRRDDLLGSLARRSTARQVVVAGVDIAPLLSPDALPDDVLAGVDRLWRTGHPREALSLLYRAALHRLGARHDFAIPESGTETECLALVERHAGRDDAASFRVLVNAWMRMAWQDRAPTDLAPLLAAWRRTAGLPAENARTEFAGGAA